MKKYSLLTALLFFLVVTASAQQQKIPNWLSPTGYWVVESKKQSPRDHIIWFYNNEHTLVYKETLTGTRLHTNRRKVRLKLKEVLETSVTAWENNKQHTEELALVKAKL